MWSIGIRAILEQSLACYYERNDGVKKESSNLKNEINAFANKVNATDPKRDVIRLIPECYWEKVHDLRHFGNDAAHRLEPIPEDARTSIARFVGDLLHVMFVLPAKLQQHQPEHPNNV